MDMQHLPPLNALRAFEAAARHLSVKAAAEELCVTPGAVSQMLKALERHLGVMLFKRVNRGIMLTATGQAYLPPIRNAFRQIGEATRHIAPAAETGILTVSVTPFFAAAWLVPRLTDFQDAHPEIDLQIVTGNALANFGRDGVDIAVRHGLGRYPGLHSDKLLTVEMAAIAAPELVARLGVPSNPAALMRWPLLHDAERKGWQLWFRAQGIDDVGPLRGPSFDDPSLLLRAVLAGQGVGLLPAAMVADEIRQDRLATLTDATRLEDFAYYLVYPEASGGIAKLAAFRAWILRAARGGEMTV